MAVDGIDRRRYHHLIYSIYSIYLGKRKEGGDPVSKHQPIRFSLGVENERADAERDGRTHLARPNSQARTETGKNVFRLFSLSRSGLPTISGRCML